MASGFERLEYQHKERCPDCGDKRCICTKGTMPETGFTGNRETCPCDSCGEKDICCVICPPLKYWQERKKV